MWKRCKPGSAGNVEVLSRQEVAKVLFLHIDRENSVVLCSCHIEDPQVFPGIGIGSYQLLPILIRIAFLRKFQRGLIPNAAQKTLLRISRSSSDS